MSVTVPGATETGIAVTRAVRELAAGGTNTRGQISLAVGQTQTQVDAEQAAEGVMVSLSPRSPAAAAAGAWISATASGSFTLSHPVAGAGCLFDYEIRR